MRISVHVTPNAHESNIVSWKDSVLFVRLRAAPREGRANEALIELLAMTFKLPKTSIRLLRGLHGKRKLLELPISLTQLSLLDRA